MGYSWWFVNHTRKDIRHTEPFNILKNIQYFFETAGWTLTDEVDLQCERFFYPRSLVEEKGYTIDYAFWH